MEAMYDNASNISCDCHSACLYDAAGNRVAKGSITTMSCDITTNGFSQLEGYVVGPSGEQLTEVGANNSTWNHTNVFAGGKLIGTYDSTGLHFHIDDPLGTRRAQVNASGTLEAVYQSLPFGDGYIESLLTPGADDPTENHFTGKERGAESGNDYMFARYYNSATGRFLSPDWSAKDDPVPYAQLTNPQSLNLYSYVYNNPLNKLDPDGHFGSELVGDQVDAMMKGAEGPFSAALDAAAKKQAAAAQQQTGCNCGTNHHFHTQNQAATAALKAIFPTSEAQLAEYGGRIYLNPDGKTYSYTTPVTQGQNGTVDPDAGQGMGNRLPAGTTSAGEYHTHPDTLAHCCAQNGFSGPDGERAVTQHIPTYIMTPAGTVFKLDGTHSNNYMTAPQSSWSANGPIP
jgi:RHS repeat-associated protein